MSFSSHKKQYITKFFICVNLKNACKEDKYPYLPFTVVEIDKKWFVQGDNGSLRNGSVCKLCSYST